MRLRSIPIALGLLMVTVSAAGALSEDATFELNGTWIGWAWLEDAGDLPLRVRLTCSADEVHGTFDSPAHRYFGATIAAAEWQSPTIRLEARSKGGSPIIIDGTKEKNTISGRIRWADYEGTIELTRSPRPLANLPPASHERAAGFYERAPGDLIELRARPWGELVYRELRSGRVRTLLPVGPDHFFIGSGIYLPFPIEAEIRLIRDENDHVTGIEESSSAGPTLSARRIDLAEKPVTFESDGTTLAGALLRRDDRSTLPAIVMLGGSTWETRDDVSFHARQLAALGFAVVSYDKRGHGDSGGEAIVPFETTAGDAIAAVEMLRKLDGIDADRVGVFGMSRGGWHAPLAASRSDEVAFLILLVPPAVSPAAQETRSRLDQMRRDGFDEATIELASSYLRATWIWMKTGEHWEEYARLRSRVVEAGVPDYVLESDSDDEVDWAWGRMNMFFEPCPVLGQLDIPVLAIFAEDDIYVSERINRATMSECIGKNARLSLHTIEGAQHSLAIPNDLPIHLQSGRGDEGFSIMADWALEIVFADRD